MAPLGQRSPHKVQSGRQYDSEKSITGVSKLPICDKSSDCRMILVGQTLAQFPHLAHTKLKSGSGKDAGGRIGLLEENSDDRGNIIPAANPRMPDIKKLLLLIADLFAPGILLKIFLAS